MDRAYAVPTRASMLQFISNLRRTIDGVHFRMLKFFVKQGRLHNLLADMKEIMAPPRTAAKKHKLGFCQGTYAELPKLGKLISYHHSLFWSVSLGSLSLTAKI